MDNRQDGDRFKHGVAVDATIATYTRLDEEEVDIENPLFSLSMEWACVETIFNIKGNSL